MNIVQQQNELKNYPDQHLQKELLSPTGMMPSYLVLSELQRRKSMRESYSAMQGGAPNTSMADEFAKGLGGAEVGQYGEAVRGTMPQGSSPTGGGPSLLTPPAPPQGMTSTQPNMMTQQPPQAFADGGGVEGDVPESWLYPSRSRFLRSIGRPDIQRSSDPRFPDILPNDPEPPGWVPEFLPPRGLPMAPQGKPYPAPQPGQPQGLGTDDFTPALGMTLGQTWANTLQGKPTGPRLGGGVQDWEPDVGPTETMAAGVDNTGQLDPGPVTGPNRQLNYGPGGIADAVDPSVVPPGLDPVRRAAAVGGASGPGGAGGGSGGGGSGRGAGAGLNEFVENVRGMALPDRFGEIERQNQMDRDKLTAGMESEKGMALLQAGLGIAGGTSPWALTNIGQGAQAGVKYWSDAKKEMRVAEQGIRQADNAIAVARANRDERQLEMSIKTKMHFEEMRERIAARQASSGDAAANREAAREDRRLDREEGRIQRDTQLAISDVNSVTAEIKTIQRSLDSLTLDEGTRKSLEDEKREKMQELRVARGRLGKLQSVRDDKTGVGSALTDPKSTNIYGTYVPGKGIVPK